MDLTENYEQLLRSMGFNDDNEIKHALAISNNDINEAVAILTNEKLPKITTLSTSSPPSNHYHPSMGPLSTNDNSSDIIMTETNLNSPNSMIKKFDVSFLIRILCYSSNISFFFIIIRLI
jgi:hypothetical protein